MAKSITIQKNPSLNDSSNYEFLRQKGMEYIEKLGSNESCLRTDPTGSRRELVWRAWKIGATWPSMKDGFWPRLCQNLFSCDFDLFRALLSTPVGSVASLSKPVSFWTSLLLFLYRLWWGLYGLILPAFPTQIQALRPHRLQQRLNTHNIHHPPHIVGEYMQTHFRSDMFQRLHLEVGVAHPGF